MELHGAAENSVLHRILYICTQEFKIAALNMQESICYLRNILVVGDFMKNNFVSLSALF